jgi:hypothetical protein
MMKEALMYQQVFTSDILSQNNFLFLCKHVLPCVYEDG